MNLDQNISNPSTCHLESTMSLFLCAEIYGQCCDLSMDPGGRATFESFPAILPLQSNVRLLTFPVRHRAIRNYSRLGLFMSLAISCIISITTSDNILILKNESDPEPSGDCLLMPCHLCLEG